MRSSHLVHIILFVLVALPIVAQAALININTANKATLEGLPHIGTATAQKIIDYRESNGPYAAIEDVRKASSYISASYYADIAPLITVGDTAAAAVVTASSTDTTGSATSPSVSTGAASKYIPPPATLTLEFDASATAVIDVPLELRAVAKMKGGNVDQSAIIHWSFGDGSASEGRVVAKTYRHAGTYLVTVAASDGDTSARDEVAVTVGTAKARIASVGGEGVVIANDASERLDLSGWRLSADFGSFRFPQGTVLLPSASVLFPYEVTNLPVAFETALYFPDGVLAARFVPVSVQPDLASAAPARRAGSS